MLVGLFVLLALHTLNKTHWCFIIYVVQLRQNGVNILLQLLLVYIPPCPMVAES